MEERELISSDMKDGAVTFLDILGWKGIWQRKTDAINNLQALTKRAEKQVDNLLNKEKFFKKKENVFKSLSVEVKSISDTIAICTYGGCDEALEFQSVISSSIICESLKLGIPVRGATCFGKFLIDGGIMVGPAIDEVASWYEAADWIGVIHTPSASFMKKETFLIENLVVDYDVLIKKTGKLKLQCTSRL